MKKFLIGCLLLLTACQTVTDTPTPVALRFPTETHTPTPVPATHTPAPTDTPQSSPTPFPRFFTSEFDSTLAGWEILQAGNEAAPAVTIDNSRLLLQMDSHFTWVYALFGEHDYDNVRIDAKFVNSAMSPASAGLVCSYSETDGWLEYNVSTNGTYNVLYGKWLASGIASYLPIVNGVSREIGQSGVEQQIGMTCSNGLLSLYINQTLVRSVDVSRYGLAGGKLGVTAASYENTPVIASFDWVSVSEP